MLEPVSAFYSSLRLRLHYLDWGNPDAPTLILVHGGLDHCRNWDPLVAQLADHFHIIAPDLRGHGDSDWSNGGAYVTSDWVYDLYALLEHLRLDKVSLLGHSLGGAICTRFAGIFPERVERLIAIEGLAPSAQMSQKRQETGVQTLAAKWIKKLERLAAYTPREFPDQDGCIQRMQEAHKNLTPELAAHLAIHGSRQLESGSYTWKFDPLVKAYKPFDLSAEEIQTLWTDIACPSLFIRGEQSWADDPLLDKRAAFFSTAEFINIADAGHWVHHDQFEAFLASIKPFLGVK